jgi:hypothetical protein
MSARRWAAVAALVLAVATLVLAVALALVRFALGLVPVAALPVALILAWQEVLRRGPPKVPGFPKPASSISTTNTFGASSGGSTCLISSQPGVEPVIASSRAATRAMASDAPKTFTSSMLRSRFSRGPRVSAGRRPRCRRAHRTGPTTVRSRRLVQRPRSSRGRPGAE